MDNSFLSIITGFLDQNLWVRLFAFSVTFLSLLLSIIFFVKSKARKSIKYISRYDTLIDEGLDQKIPGLSILVSNKQINKLAISRIAFWNNGNKTITYDDIPTLSKFTITIDNNYDILDISLIEILNQNNNISVKLLDNCKTIEIYFEYIDKGDGFVLQIFHTGNDISALKINGVIKGGKITKGKYDQRKERGIISDINLLIYLVTFFIYVILIVLNGRNIISAFILFILFIAVIIYLIYTIYSTFLAIPSKIKKYFNKIRL